MIGEIPESDGRAIRAAARRLIRRIPPKGAMDAEDLAQEGLLALCEAWRRGQDPSGPLLHRVALMGMRRALGRLVVWESEAAAAKFAALRCRRRGLDRDDRLDVKDAVGRLPGPQAEAVTLKLWGGCTNAEAGSRIGATKAAVHFRWKAAVEVLSDILREPYAEEFARTIPFRDPARWKTSAWAKRTGKPTGKRRPHVPGERAARSALRLAVIQDAARLNP